MSGSAQGNVDVSAESGDEYDTGLQVLGLFMVGVHVLGARRPNPSREDRLLTVFSSQTPPDHHRVLPRDGALVWFRTRQGQRGEHDGS